MVRISAFVATVDRSPGRGAILPTADALWSFPVPSEGSTGSAEAPPLYVATTGAQQAPSLKSPTRGTDSTVIPVSALSTPGAPASLTSPPPSGYISIRMR